MSEVICYSYLKQCWHRFQTIEEMLEFNHSEFVNGGHRDCYVPLAICEPNEPLKSHAVRLAYEEKYGRPGVTGDRPAGMSESRAALLQRVARIVRRIHQGTYLEGDTGEEAQE